MTLVKLLSENAEFELSQIGKRARGTLLKQPKAVHIVTLTWARCAAL